MTKEAITKDPLAPPTTVSAKAANKEAPSGGDTAKDAAAKKEAKAEKAPKRSKFQLLYPEGSKITLLAKENPKKEGSACRERFQHYFSIDVKTVGNFIAAGGTYADIAYDVGRRFISVEVVADPVLAPAETAGSVADPKAA